MTTLFKIIEINLIRPSAGPDSDLRELKEIKVIQSKGKQTIKLFGSGIAMVAMFMGVIYLLRKSKSMLLSSSSNSI
jgi:hypothetical protein